MEITSVAFLVFAGVSMLIYWHLPTKYQWLVLLIDSLIFYFVNASAYTFIYLLVGVASVYFATTYFHKNPGDDKAGNRKAVLILSLLVTVGILAVLKYTNLGINTISFFTERISGRSLNTVKWLAPLGISFYTLTLVSYLLDSYWGVTEYEKNPFKLLLYTSFFPLMISGPVSSHNDYGVSLFSQHRFDYDRVTKAARRIAFGIIKKAVVADRLFVVTEYMFANPDVFTGIFVWLATAVYVVELYFDFSGCMDIVIGVSLAFGIELTENFKAPFLSKTIQEFWQRWHISLGNWLKSYIMYPLLKSDAFVRLADKCRKKYKKKGKKYPTFLAMLVLWSLMGLWHGNSWKFIIGEGLWFWLVIVLSQLLSKTFDKWREALHIKAESLWFQIFRALRTFLLFTFGMLFFRADTLELSLYMIRKTFTHAPLRDTLKNLYQAAWDSFGGFAALMVTAVVVLVTFVVDIFIYNEKSFDDRFKKYPGIIRWIVYFAMSALIVYFGVFGKSSFIYFGF